MFSLGLVHGIAAFQSHPNRASILLGMTPVRTVAGTLFWMERARKTGMWDAGNGLINLAVVYLTYVV